MTHLYGNFWLSDGHAVVAACVPTYSHPSVALVL